MKKKKVGQSLIKSICIPTSFIATQKEITEYEDAVDDTDGIDEEAEFDAWRIRELNRIKRDREERIA